MAGCDRGYLCVVCGEEVEEITESALYLRYVLGEVVWEELDRAPESHIRCDTALAQFIVDATFEPVKSAGAFAKADLDPDFVRTEEVRVTRAYRRLQGAAAANLPFWEYPVTAESQTEDG
jgi:hypothetical protein